MNRTSTDGCEFGPPTIGLILLVGVLLMAGCQQFRNAGNERIASIRAETIEINTSARYQEIEGWGGHFYPQSLPFFDSDSLFEKSMYRDLASTHARIRSYWYELEGRNDNDDANIIDWDRIATGDTGLVHDEFLLQQRLFRAGLKLQFAAWRFPYWMVEKPPDWRPDYTETPALPEGMDEEFLESITAYLLYARDRYGIQFDAVSVANEPDIGIYITGLDPARLLVLSQQLRERLDDAGYVTNYYLPDVSAADSISVTYTREFFGLEGASQSTISLAYHSYRRTRDNLEVYAEQAERFGLPVWITEQNDTHLGVEDRHEWSHALKNATALFDVLTFGNASLCVYFSFAMQTSGGLGLYLPEFKAWSPAYEMLKHFFNHVPPGSVRIGSSPVETSSGVQTVAFQLADSDDIALILINPAKTEREISLLLPSGFSSQGSGWMSDQTRRYAPFSIDDGKLMMPPGSVITVEYEHQGEE